MTAVPKLEVKWFRWCSSTCSGLQTAQGPAVRRDESPREHADAAVDVPQRQLKLDELVTRRYRLDQINDAITDMREGRNIRGIIEFD